MSPLRELRQRERAFISAVVGLTAGILMALIVAAVIGIARQASEAQRLAKDDARIAFLVQRVETVRTLAIREACVAQNRRHDQTIIVLDHLLKERLVGHGRAPESVRVERERTRQATVLLIDALAPKQNC